GSRLYDLLRGAPAYQLALVGWDVDFWLGITELTANWSTEIGDGSLNGLVSRKSLLSRLPDSTHFAEFDDDHVWIPYTGSQSI
ncbi:MAG: hypothetical protein MI757_07620, partial [Pirellulales bacterium]|nr:hypothetical protein [Pirellulales bacterium]